MQVNYIKHLEAVFDKISLDDRLSTVHLGLYYSLFHHWNLAKFQNPISICRSELMRTSKIGSANTYTRCLRELHKWGYIEYLPSHNPNRGSLVNLYRFDTTSNKSNDKTTDTTPVKAVRPSTNSTKQNKQTKPIKLDRAQTRFSPPVIDEVKTFFIESGSGESEAENFHNYFESNGWLVGGKAKMKNWKAAARNWIKRSSNFKTTNRATSQNRLNTNNDKDYAIPL